MISRTNESHPSTRIDKLSIFEKLTSKINAKKVGAAILIAATGTLTACGTTSAEGISGNKATASAKASVEATPAPISSEKAKTYSSESDKIYAGYLETLSAGQKTVRENLSPDSLADMTDAQITEAFTIRATEVADGAGKINPQLYAEAFAARSEGLLTAGCSLKEYKEAGGLEATNSAKSAAQHALALKYGPLASTALVGHKAGETTANESTTLRCMIIDDIRADKLDPKPEAYRLRLTVADEPIKAVVNPDKTVDMTVAIRLMDNWNTDVMHFHGSPSLPASDKIETDTITGLHINPDGAVVPGTIVVNR